MTHQVESDQIAQNLQEHAGTTDAFGIAQNEGLWLRPQLGGEPDLRGRVVVFDVTAPLAEQHSQVMRCVEQFHAQRRDRIALLAGLGESEPQQADESLQAS